MHMIDQTYVSRSIREEIIADVTDREGFSQKHEYQISPEVEVTSCPSR